MILYATRTGTRRNNAILCALGFRRIISHIAPPYPADLQRKYAIDNGAWTAHVQGKPWAAESFEAFVSRYGQGADFVVVPDIVAGGAKSLRLSESWLPRLDHLPLSVHRQIAVQDGMEEADVRPLVGSRVGIFVGGSSEWKDKTMAAWADLAHRRSCWVHVGRVNTRARLMRAAACGVDSSDGTGATRFSVHAEKMDRWNQPALRLMV